MVKSDLSAIQFRPADKSECRTIASLYSMSSDGVADYVWAKLAQSGEDILDVGQRRYEQEDSVFSYKNCTVATQGNEIVGMLVAFPMESEETAEPSEQDPVLAPYSRLEENHSYYICGMAVVQEYRGLGLGSKFLALAEEQARKKGYNKLSLIVFEQNQGAKRLYERHGYSKVAREPVIPHALIHYSGDALLLVKQLT